MDVAIDVPMRSIDAGISIYHLSNTECRILSTIIEPIKRSRCHYSTG
jgi:hypothetical protein